MVVSIQTTSPKLHTDEVMDLYVEMSFCFEINKLVTHVKGVYIISYENILNQTFEVAIKGIGSLEKWRPDALPMNFCSRKYLSSLSFYLESGPKDQKVCIHHHHFGGI